jgi:hypothetical protein
MLTVFDLVRSAAFIVDCVQSLIRLDLPVFLQVPLLPGPWRCLLDSL